MGTNVHGGGVDGTNVHGGGGDGYKRSIHSLVVDV